MNIYIYFAQPDYYQLVRQHYFRYLGPRFPYVFHSISNVRIFSINMIPEEYR